MNRDVVNKRDRLPNGGPYIVVPSLWSAGENPGSLLTEEDRSLLAVIATVGRYKKGELIYREGARADSVFNIITGVVKCYQSRPKQKQQILGFLFPHDIAGLADQGRYVNSATAVTPVTLYRIPSAAMEARLRKNPGLDFQVICKLCHDLRSAQQHAVLLSKHRAVAKLGLFLQMLETHQSSDGRLPGEILVPMSRIDMGAYMDMSPEAVSRALHELVRRGVISMRDRRHIRIIDRTLLEDAVWETGASKAALEPV